VALAEIEAARVKKVVAAFIEKRRPPPHIRPKLDVGYRVTGQSVEIFEVRPVWDGGPSETLEGPVAKATYVRARKRWRIFWMRADLKWHSYAPAPEVASIDEFLALVDEDVNACFWG